MSNYLSVFLAPGMLVGAAAVLLVAGVLTWAFRQRFNRPGVRLAWFLFVFSVGVVVLVTLLRESPTGPCVACLGDWQLTKVLTGAAGTDVLLNVALFVPPAFLATLLWRAPWRVTGAGLLMSLVIEVAQPLLGVGANDAIDLVANTAGAAIGAGAAAVVLLISDALRDRHLDARRTVRVALSVAACAAVLVGGPAWKATAQQSAVADQFQRYFAGTTLADDDAHGGHDLGRQVHPDRHRYRRPDRDCTQRRHHRSGAVLVELLLRRALCHRRMDTQRLHHHQAERRRLHSNARTSALTTHQGHRARTTRPIEGGHARDSSRQAPPALRGKVGCLPLAV